MPPPPGMRPSLISGWPSLASSAQMRTSQHIASSSPPPRQKPLIAATNGMCAASIRVPDRCIPRAEPPSLPPDSRSAGNSLMSAPATNARSPAPRMTTARSPASPSSASISASSSVEQRRRERVHGRVVDRDERHGALVLGRDERSQRSSYGSRPAVGRRELLPQRSLAELADGRLRDLVDVLEALGQPPLREARREEGAQLVGVGRLRPRGRRRRRAAAPTTSRRARRSPRPRATAG